MDYFITTLAFFGQSMPVFWFALMMQLLVRRARHSAAGRVHDPASVGGHQYDRDAFDLGDRLSHLVLPVIVLSLLNLAVYSRFMRSSLLEVTQAPTTCAPPPQKA